MTLSNGEVFAGIVELSLVEVLVVLRVTFCGRATVSLDVGFCVVGNVKDVVVTLSGNTDVTLDEGISEAEKLVLLFVPLSDVVGTAGVVGTSAIEDGVALVVALPIAIMICVVVLPAVVLVVPVGIPATAVGGVVVLLSRGLNSKHILPIKGYWVMLNGQCKYR